MKCPLSFIYRFQGEGTNLLVGFDCLKEECAWWEEGDNQCILLSFIPPLMSIATTLQDIREKMPHLEQFKRP